MDPTKGQDQSIKWTNAPGSQTYKSTKWTDPTKGQDHGPQNGRTQVGLNFYKSTK